MVNLDLPWPAAAITAGGLTGLAAAIRLAARRRPHPVTARLAVVAPFLREAGTVLALFALWQLAGSHQILGSGGAFGRARWLWRAERVLHMPSETAVQR